MKGQTFRNGGENKRLKETEEGYSWLLMADDVDFPFLRFLFVSLGCLSKENYVSCTLLVE